jgi:2-amino-4-hydroxy-6-hydroxymethyldihydropteridine diphosphokinase
VPLAYIGLGSNLGDRLGQMRHALDLLQAKGHTRVQRSSPVYQNRAVGMGEDARDFLNAVAEVRTTLAPLALLDACLVVEEQLERTRSEQGWAPRTIDLDLLVYEGTRLREERLTLPHPRIEERDFVAVPLADLAPELQIHQQSMRRIAQGLVSDALVRFPEELLGGSE